MLSEDFIWLAVAIAAGGNVFYLLDTLKGKTKPNRVTFFLWGAAPLITYFAQRNGGAGSEVLYTLIIAAIPLVIFAASFVDKRAYWAITKFDIACGVVSLAALIALVLTKDPMLALVLSIVADLFAGIPTLIKCYKYPQTETAKTYAIEIISSVIALLTIQTWVFTNYSFAAYVLVMNVLFTGLLIFPRKKSQSVAV